MLFSRTPSPAKWAYMQEIGRTKYLITRTLAIMAIFFAANLLGPFLGGATVHSVSWPGLFGGALVIALFVFLQVRAYWSWCEDSAVLRRPTVHTPRFEGDIPPAGHEGLRRG